MSSRNARLREKWQMHVPPASGEDGEDDTLDWQPDWGRHCGICGQTPCMVGVRDGVVVVETARCADCIDEDMASRLAVGSGY